MASPTATTEEASSVEATSATLRGEVNPGGEETEYHFQYGLASTDWPARGWENRENHAPNPKAENDTTGLLTGTSGYTDAAFTRESCAWDDEADHCFRLVGTKEDNSSFIRLRLWLTPGQDNGAPTAEGDIWECSAYINVLNPTTPLDRGLQWSIVWYDSDGVQMQTQSSLYVSDRSWLPGRRFTWQSPPAPEGATYARLGMAQGTDEPLDEIGFEVTRILFEKVA